MKRWVILITITRSLSLNWYQDESLNLNFDEERLRIWFKEFRIVPSALYWCDYSRSTLQIVRLSTLMIPFYFSTWPNNIPVPHSLTTPKTFSLLPRHDHVEYGETPKTRNLANHLPASLPSDQSEHFLQTTWPIRSFQSYHVTGSGVRQYCYSTEHSNLEDFLVLSLAPGRRWVWRDLDVFWAAVSRSILGNVAQFSG